MWTFSLSRWVFFWQQRRIHSRSLIKWVFTWVKGKCSLFLFPHEKSPGKETRRRNIFGSNIVLHECTYQEVIGMLLSSFSFLLPSPSSAPEIRLAHCCRLTEWAIQPQKHTQVQPDSALPLPSCVHLGSLPRISWQGEGIRFTAPISQPCSKSDTNSISPQKRTGEKEIVSREKSALYFVRQSGVSRC